MIRRKDACRVEHENVAFIGRHHVREEEALGIAEGRLQHVAGVVRMRERGGGHLIPSNRSRQRL